ncbi:MAG: serine hydrolase [Saprospiraceae bacterium]|nr:serine hydrolase [Saprospiraceae bacterium]
MFFRITMVALMISYLNAQSLYFPPADGSRWDTLAPERLNWCNEKIDSLYQFLEDNNSRGFILLKDGKIVLEKYFKNHNASKIWYWASAGKSLTSFMVGLAQQDSFLKISDQTSKYLGNGWTSCLKTTEDKITIYHQLSMTTGLDDSGIDPYCTLDTCLICIADAGNRWAYHNGPYTLLDSVIESATKMKLNQYISQKLTSITGITGIFIKSDFNNVFYSTGRTMARFGLLNLAKGSWNGIKILQDQNYFNAMTHSSQNINPAYGYLWWLNGSNFYKVPGLQIPIPGLLMPNAPHDTYAALGKNGQFINIAPSKNMVWVRFGDAPDSALVPYRLSDDIWRYIANMNCNSSSTLKLQENKITVQKISTDRIRITTDDPISDCKIVDTQGRIINQYKITSFITELHTPAFSGLYFIIFKNTKGQIITKKLMM